MQQKKINVCVQRGQEVVGSGVVCVCVCVCAGVCGVVMEPTANGAS